MNAMDLMLAQATEAKDSTTPSAPEATTTTLQPGTTEESGGAGGAPVSKQQNPLISYLPIILIIIIFYFFMFRGPRKRQQEQRAMLANIKKADKVQTIGGIVGTVVDVRDDEVVLKIDEANNTKMHIVRSAIGRVIKADETVK